VRADLRRWSPRRGFFEGPARVFYRHVRRRYVDALAVAVAINGVIVAAFGVLVLALYLDAGAGTLAVFAACSSAGYIVENAVAGAYLRRASAPVAAWLAGEPGDDAWSAAARIPFVLLRRPSLYLIGAVGAAGADVTLASLLDLPVYQAALLFPTSYLVYLSSAVLRCLGLELAVRPLLEAIGYAASSPPGLPSVSIHRRLLATVPMINWGASMIVAGLLTTDSRRFDTIGIASGVAVAVTAAVSIWLSLVLADSVSGPIVDLRDATRRVTAGNLDVRVPVVSIDETGELSASFNAMVTGLAERERLHEAFRTFIDPAVTERVLAEGTDLPGEELDVSVLFLDVRDFTRFAERADSREIVASLNELYDAVVPVILRHGGHTNKFIGDGLLAVFGAPDRHPDHASRAVAAAREIADLVRTGRCGRLRVGIGVNSGTVVVGTVGGGERRDFTVIGDAVNTAARVEAATRATGDDVLITEMTLRALGADAVQFEERSPPPLRGKAATVRVYAPV
jgi:adenylate cyclase